MSQSAFASSILIFLFLLSWSVFIQCPALSDCFSRVSGTKKTPPRKSHTRRWNTQNLETVTMTCGISNVDHKSSCFFSPRRSLKCPNLSNHVSFRSSKPFSWKAIAYLVNFYDFSSKPFLTTMSSLPPGQIYCMSVLHFCTHPSLCIHRTALK